MKQTILLFAALLFMPAFVLASDAEAQTLILRGGMSPTVESQSIANNAADLSPHSQIGIRVGYADYLKLEGSALFQPASGVDGSTYGGQISLQVFPIDDIMSLNPYLFAGLARMNNAVTTIPLGIGVEYPVIAGIGVNMQGGIQYNGVFDQDHQFASSMGPGVSVGVTYSIGRAKQTVDQGGADPILALFDGSDSGNGEEIVEEAPAETTADANVSPADTSQNRSRAAGGVPGPATEPPHAMQLGDLEEWEDMVRLPDGTFIMGLTDEDPLTLQTAGRKRVTVSTFYLDRYAVSNEDYRDYLQDLSAGEREAAFPDSSVWDETGNRYSWNEYFRGSAYSDFPVIGVSHEQAQQFCEFYDKRLPTEAEWEYAGRAGQVGGIYPWAGFEPRDQQGRYLANYNPGRGGYAADGYAFTAPVDEYPPNPWGLYNMSGNVAEWVADAYTNTYADLSDFNPLFTDEEETRHVTRGGSWASDAFDIGVGVRDYQEGEQASPYTGFRCAMDLSDAQTQQEESGEEPQAQDIDDPDAN